MCEEVNEDIPRPANLNLKIGTDGIAALDFAPLPDKRVLVAGTSNGRVRM